MGPKPTAVDQAGRPPRKQMAGTCGFQTADGVNHQVLSLNPVPATIMAIWSIEIESLVITTPECVSCEITACRIPGVALRAFVRRPEQQPQVIPSMLSLWVVPSMEYPWPLPL